MCRRPFSREWINTVAPESWQPWLRLARFDRPAGFWLLMWPCWWTVVMASPGWSDHWTVPRPLRRWRRGDAIRRILPGPRRPGHAVTDLRESDTLDWKKCTLSRLARKNAPALRRKRRSLLPHPTVRRLRRMEFWPRPAQVHAVSALGSRHVSIFLDDPTLAGRPSSWSRTSGSMPLFVNSDRISDHVQHGNRADTRSVRCDHPAAHDGRRVCHRRGLQALRIDDRADTAFRRRVAQVGDHRAGEFAVG